MATPAELRKLTEEAKREAEAKRAREAAQDDALGEAYLRRAEVIVSVAELNAEDVAAKGGDKVEVMSVYGENSGMGMEKEGFLIPDDVLQKQRMAMAEPYFWLTRVAWYVYIDLAAKGYTISFVYRGTHREYFKMFISW